MRRRGHDVVLLRARSSAPCPAGCREETFSTFSELDAALTRILSTEHIDAVVHAAAVSDFGVGEVEVGGEAREPGAGKLDSDSAPILRLKPHPKLVDSLRARSLNDSVRIVAFKLTYGEDRDHAIPAARALLERSGADLVVQNDLAERRGPDAFPATIHFQDGSPPDRCATRPELAAALERILSGRPENAA